MSGVENWLSNISESKPPPSGTSNSNITSSPPGSLDDMWVYPSPLMSTQGFWIPQTPLEAEETVQGYTRSNSNNVLVAFAFIHAQAMIAEQRYLRSISDARAHEKSMVEARLRYQKASEYMGSFTSFCEQRSVPLAHCPQCSMLSHDPTMDTPTDGLLRANADLDGCKNLVV